MTSSPMRDAFDVLIARVWLRPLLSIGLHA
jgi:hypothetical protein